MRRNIEMHSWKLKRLQISPEIELEDDIPISCFFAVRSFMGFGSSQVLARLVSGLQSDISWQDLEGFQRLGIAQHHPVPGSHASKIKVRYIQLQ